MRQAFDENWIAPLGPHVDAFEMEFAAAVDAPHAVAVSSGTAALHLALILAGVGPRDIVLVSTLTFAASVNPIIYVGATPHFIDCDTGSWNMDPQLLRATLDSYARRGRLPKAVIVVHLYGQPADMASIMPICAEYGVLVIEDAAEALGAMCGGRAPGTFAPYGIYSFNGNKMITTSGGGMLVTSTQANADHARKLATQAREPVPHYEHVEVGYNYRLSNVLAAIGRGQLRCLAERVAARRRNFEFYKSAFANVPGIMMMPEAGWGTHARWLTTLTVDSEMFGATPDEIRLALEARNIEARPVWKPMHRQPIFRDHPATGGSISDRLFDDGLCLPSGSALNEADLSRVIEAVLSVGGSSA